MKKHAILGLSAALAVMFFGQSSFAQKKFEGSINWKTKSAQLGDDEMHDMTMNVKGDKFEIDMDAGVNGLVHMYVDHANKKVTMVMDAQKMGIVKDIPDDAAVADKAKEIDLKPTGQKSTIGGHNAELYILTSPQETVNMWMSKDFGPELAEGLRAAMANNMRGSQAQKQAFRDLAEKGYFPVKIESKDGGSLELVSIEPKSLPDSKFSVPSDVTVMPAMGGMGDGMGRSGMHPGMPAGGGQ